MSLLLSLQNAELKYSNKQILSGANWQIHTGQRFALIGRNGAGKSTLMQVLAGQIALDKGTVSYQKGLKIATLPQDLSKSFGHTVFEDIYYRVIGQGGLNPQIKISDFYIEDGQLKLDSLHHDDPMLLDFVNKCNQYCRVMQLNYHVEWLSMSGGMKRRSALVAALLVEPDVLFLDEPTNHLDIQAIVWLEQYLLSFKGAVIFVTHDRYFLKAVANHIMALEFELLKQYNDGYEAYLTQRDAELAAIENENNRLKNRLAAEEHWLHRGVTARRARNQGRLNALLQLRQVIAERQKNIGIPGQWNPQVIGSGRVLFTAENAKFSYPNQNIIDDFSFILMRGDKLGIVGPNGCGKTTLAKLLLGEFAPQQGQIKFSNRLEPIYFDQLQKQLDGEQTLMYNIANGAEYVELPEGKVHVAGYLKNFSFMPDQLQRPVHTLSGGEKQRLMLAKCLAKQGNLMVFDEPSNDLDLESLEQLASMMVSYTGTFILISHDRALIEDVVTRLLVWEAPGVFKEILPSEWEPKRHLIKSNEPAPATVSKAKPAENRSNLNYNEQKELKKLPDEIAKLEKKISDIHAVMADVNFYQQPSLKRDETVKLLQSLEQKLSELFERWEHLESK
jgi:ATP-binding cassette subfamily F protein uup